MSDWQPWIEKVAEAVGIEPEIVDVKYLHDLTGEVSARFERPMAPVAAYLVGIAQGQYPDADPDELAQKVLAALP